jgi:hypothetical protein
MISRIAICFVLLAACGLLSISAQPAVPASQVDLPLAPFASARTSFIVAHAALGVGIATKCSTIGRPCSPGASTCCPGSKCVFRGGSTRVGYACVATARSTDRPESAWELSATDFSRNELKDVLR